MTKHDLNTLIMDYLVVEGYTSAAEEFSKEAQLTTSAPNFDLIESRMDIKRAIQRGDIGEAIEKVNDLNPDILDTNPALYFHLHQQRLIELIRQGNVSEALRFAREELAPRGEENTEFLAELENTMALLAFDASGANAASTPRRVAELLLPQQRQKTANEVNTAILESMSQNKEAKLFGLLRLLAWGETLLAERADFPRMNLDAGLVDSSGGSMADGLPGVFADSEMGS